MHIKFEVHGLENSQGTGEERKFVRLRNNLPLSADELANEISEASTVTPADVKAVMSEISRIAKHELLLGARFYLPEIGYLSLSVGCKQPSEVKDGKITGKDVFVKGLNFRPETKFLDHIKRRAKFEKSDFSTISRRYSEDALWKRVESYLQTNRYLTVREMCAEFGMSVYMAKKWLARFVDSGKLIEDDARHLKVYFLA